MNALVWNRTDLATYVVLASSPHIGPEDEFEWGEARPRLNVASLESLRADMGFTMDTEPK